MPSENEGSSPREPVDERDHPPRSIAPPRAPLVSARLAFALAAISGVLYFLGFPGPDLWPATFVAQAPLLVALYHQRPGRAAQLGSVAGFTFSVTTFYWLYGTLRLFGQLSPPLALLVMLLMCGYQSGRMALTAWLTARAEQRGWPLAPAFLLAFIAGELLYPLLFPWYLAVTAHGAPVLWQVADLGGVYLVAVVLLGSNLAIAELVRARLEGDRASRATVALGLLAPLLAIAYGAVRMRQIDARAAEAQTLVVGIAQGNQPVVGRHEGFKIHRRLTNALRDRDADLVVWSEGSVQEVFDDADYQETAKKQITRFLRVPVLFGAGIVHRDGDRKREHNTALLAEADGTIVGRYDKQFLLPFGEYLPFGETFPSLYASSPHTSRLSPGSSMEPMAFRGYRISTIICYEDILPDFVNRLVSHANPDLLVNITIDTWFGRTIEPWEHLGLARLRAVEHRRYLVRATNSGLSAIVDANGVVTMHGKLFEEEALLGEAKLMRGRTVYEVVGDWPFYGCAAVVMGMAMVRRRKRAASV